VDEMQFFLAFEEIGVVYVESNLRHYLERYIDDKQFMYAYWRSGLSWVVLDKASAKRLLDEGVCSAIVYNAPPTYPTAKVLGTVKIQSKDLERW
jgi:hypothetical protein